MKEDSLLSKTIAWLRFPLIVLVVFIHIPFGENWDWNDFLPAFPQAFYAVGIFRYEIATIAVPLFFVISGFLFFRGNAEFTREIYFKKLRSRARSLLFPYLIWCSISAIFGLIVLWNQGEFYTLKILKRIAASFLATGFANIPFWFIRELIVCVIVSPILYFCIRRWKWILPIALAVISCSFKVPNTNGYLIPGTEIPMFLRATSFFFFSVGATLAIEKIDFIEIVRKYAFSLGILWAIVMVLDLSQSQGVFATHPVLHHFAIFIGVAAAFGLVARGIENGILRERAFLTGATFFVFAAHTYALWLFNKIYPRLVFDNFGRGNVTIILAEYLGVLFAVLLCLAIWWILKKAFPRIAAVLVGGR